ncbi:MAG TPA: secretin N-terminal domain-containing protein [Thermoanaerobaculia bacterium]|nr:secretin N-terminal domain-containing protein [Thermoanaerobaculia bacterium]
MKRFALMMMCLLLVSASVYADAAEGRSLSVRTFQFKHKQADQAAAAIKPLVSASGSMSIQPGANALVVTDEPENLKKIAAAIAAFDTPPQTFQLSIRIVSAERAAADRGRVDRSLEDVAPKLALLRYNVLENAGAADVLGKEGDPGLVDLGTYRANFAFGEYDAASDSLKLSDFRLARRDGDQLAPLLKTTLNLKIGQTVILGATRQPDSQRALMIVVAVKR